MKKKAIITYLICLLLMLTGCGTKYKESKFSETYRVDYSGSNNQNDIKYIIDSNTKMELAFFGEYYYDFEVEGTLTILDEYSTSTNYPKVKMDKYLVNIYNFETNEKVKEIDIVEKAEKCVDMNVYQFSQDFIYGIVKRDNTYYLVISMEKIPNDEEMKEKKTNIEYYFYVGINEENDLFDENGYEKLEYYLAYREDLGPLQDGDFTSINIPVDDGYGFNLMVGYNPHWYKTSEEDISILRIDTWRLKHLKENDILLYEEFPEIENYVSDTKNHSEQYLILYIKGRTWEEILSLFMPRDKEITFEGFKLYDDETKDGEEHVINSYDEYKKYAKWPKSDDIFYKEIDGVE